MESPFEGFCLALITAKPTHFKQMGIYCSMALISTLALTSVVWTIYSHKKLQQHPSSLIAVICLIEAINVYIALINVP